MSDLKERISKRIDEAIKAKVFPGCVVGIVNKGREKMVLPFGKFTYERGANRVREDTIFDVASITKSIPTASLALKLIDEGKLGLEDKLIDYIPEFRNSDRKRVLIKHLLTYTLDGYGLASLGEITAHELEEYLMTKDFENRPGTVFKYTNIPAGLLGMIVEKIYGKKLDQLGSDYFFKPLKMQRTTFHPNDFSLEEIVPTEDNHTGAVTGLVHGVVHDESAAIFRLGAGKVMGHAGLFSTAPDILNYIEMLLNGGEIDGKRYFSEDIVTQMHTNQIEELNDFTGLGWELYQPRYMGKLCTNDTFGKTGFTGCLCVCDIPKGVGYAILSNRIYPSRPKDSSAINKLRADIGDIIWQIDTLDVQ